VLPLLEQQQQLQLHQQLLQVLPWRPLLGQVLLVLL
jgi:hypothetical protein